MPAAQTPTRGTGIPAIKFLPVAGAAAGNIAVAGIRLQDHLIAVLNLTAHTDVTAEFTISAAGQINNTGGTSTAAKELLVVWYPTPVGIAG